MNKESGYRVGQNTVSAEQLKNLVERIETLRAEGKQIAAEIAAVMGEAKAAGFVKGGISTVIRLRAMKPHARQEAEAIRDQYLHALGDEAELPLFRLVSLMAVDRASRDSVIEALKAFVPQGGSIVIEAGGRPVRLTRDEAGVVTAREVAQREEAPADAPPRFEGPVRAPIPDVDGDGAEQLGGEACRANEPVIKNPFPFGDARRGRWDGGWRKASGSDGMGPGGGR